MSTLDPDMARVQAQSTLMKFSALDLRTSLLTVVVDVLEILVSIADLTLKMLLLFAKQVRLSV